MFKFFTCHETYLHSDRLLMAVNVYRAYVYYGFTWYLALIVAIVERKSAIDDQTKSLYFIWGMRNVCSDDIFSMSVT